MRYWLAATVLSFVALGFPLPASAQYGRARPECRGMGDPRACTCALDNGGMLAPDNHRPGRFRWNAPKRGTGAHMAFMNCASGVR